MQRDRRLDAADHIFLERPAQPHQAFVAGLAVDDELRDQAVVIGRHGVALIERAVDAHAEPARRVVIGDPARRRAEALGVLGVDPAFDGMAGEADLGLAIAERGAVGDAQLLAHDVDAADHLADRMLDLKPRVHLDEKEFAVLVEKFEGAGAAIAERRASHRRRARRSGSRSVGVERRRRRFLEHLLMRALQRAVALAEMNDAALAVAEDLDLDMPRPVEIMFEIDLAAPEKRHPPRAARSAAYGRVRRGRGRPSCRGRRRPPPP